MPVYLGFPRFAARHVPDVEATRQFQELQQVIDGLHTYIESLEERLVPVTGFAEIDPILSLDPVTWTEITLSNSNLPDADGTEYWVLLRLDVQGSNANSWVQLRITWGTIGEVIGAQVDIGNNARVSVTDGLNVTSGSNLTFWLRGSASELLSGRISVHRIGSGHVPAGTVNTHGT